jgi:hypothetical protein
MSIYTLSCPVGDLCRESLTEDEMARRKKKTPQSQSTPREESSGNAGLYLKLFCLGAILTAIGYLLITSLGSDPILDGPGSARTSSSSPAAVTDIPIDDDRPVAPVTVSPNFVDFGNLAQNITVKRDVTLRNNGNTPLRIRDVRPSCPCTKIQRNHNTIEPGQTIAMELEMDSEARLGSKSVSVNIVFDGYQPVRIPLRATVVESTPG